MQRATEDGLIRSLEKLTEEGSVRETADSVAKLLANSPDRQSEEHHPL